MGENNTQRLKLLQCEANSIKVDLQKLADNKGSDDRKLEVRQRLDEINEEIKHLKKSGPIISEHAIIRYLQRVKRLDLDRVKDEMLNQRLKKSIMTLGDGRYPIGQGNYLIVKNQVVVTVLNKDNAISKSRRGQS